MPNKGSFVTSCVPKAGLSVLKTSSVSSKTGSHMSFHISQNEPLNSFCNAIIVVVSNNSISCCKHLQTDTNLALTKTALKINAAVS